jgi:hypothetical protein
MMSLSSKCIRYALYCFLYLLFSLDICFVCFFVDAFACGAARVERYLKGSLPFVSFSVVLFGICGVYFLFDICMCICVCTFVMYVCVCVCVGHHWDFELIYCEVRRRSCRVRKTEVHTLIHTRARTHRITHSCNRSLLQSFIISFHFIHFHSFTHSLIRDVAL